MSHSPEPWTIISAGSKRDLRIQCADGSLVADPVANDDGIADGDRDRIVACVSFCRGIPTEWMKGRIVKLIMHEEESSIDGWKSLADIPNLEGLIPVCKEPT